jgi:hypothetical protein
MRRFQLDPLNGLGDVTFGRTANGKTISPHFFGKRGDNKGVTPSIDENDYYKKILKLSKP